MWKKIRSYILFISVPLAAGALSAWLTRTNTDIYETINIIKEQISKCEQSCEMFDLPNIKNVKVVVNDLPNEGADLLHREYKIDFPDGEYIHIDYHSKDKCRTFQINPDRSVISVKCSQPELNFEDSWDEK